MNPGKFDCSRIKPSKIGDYLDFLASNTRRTWYVSRKNRLGTQKSKITKKEQVIEIESKLKSINFDIFQAERFLAIHPNHKPTKHRKLALLQDKNDLNKKLFSLNPTQ